MRLYQVAIRNFRGIKELDWTVGGKCACLVGPGDSSKSTILDAIELALSPRYRLYIDDSDFYDLEVENAIEIFVTAGPVPEVLQMEQRFGLCMRGWNAEDGLLDEPEDEIPVLTIHLRIDSSLEPSWVVISERDPDGKTISAADRAHFGAVRLGDVPSWQLSWRRGSILSRLTGDVESLPAILAEASRAARMSIEEHQEALAPLLEASQRAEELGKEFGVAKHVGYAPNLDVQAGAIREGGLSLHDGVVPLRRAGLGSRRLLSLALQRAASSKAGITLIDEIEYGLEPYRVRQLLRNLGGDVFLEDVDGAGEQIVMATHSSVAVEQLDARNIGVVRSEGGTVTVATVGEELQGVIRSSSEALLARRILLCEGKTEPGLVTALDRCWAEAGFPPFAAAGVAIAVGGGRTEAPGRALRLSELGYDVAYFGDSDEPMEPPRETLEAAGVPVFAWGEDSATEDRVFRDLPWPAILDALRVTGRSEQSIRDATAAQYGDSDLEESIAEWNDSPEMREALATASKIGKWYKTVSQGESLGEIICENWDSIGGTNLLSVISALRSWAHPDDHA